MSHRCPSSRPCAWLSKSCKPRQRPGGILGERICYRTFRRIGLYDRNDYPRYAPAVAVGRAARPAAEYSRIVIVAAVALDTPVGIQHHRKQRGILLRGATPDYPTAPVIGRCNDNVGMRTRSKRVAYRHQFGRPALRPARLRTSANSNGCQHHYRETEDHIPTGSIERSAYRTLPTRPSARHAMR